MMICGVMLSAMLLGHVLVSGAESPTTTMSGGGYMGTCTNQTYGITSRLHLVLHEQEGQVSGSLELSGELVGAGAITGTVEDGQVIFTTVWEFGEITWFGRMEGKIIHGGYLVHLADGSAQKGIWSARKG